MVLEPLYRTSREKLAYRLRYSWTGWTRGETAAQPEVVVELKPLWEQDGLRLLEQRWTDRHVQLAFSTLPDVSPVFLAARAKGRLQHALRKSGGPFAGFTRMVSVRSVGENTRRDVEAYIAGQVGKEQFVDPRFRAEMQRYAICCPDVDLSHPSASARGRYWYNLHLVLVTVERYRLSDPGRLATIRDGSLRIAAKKGYAISVGSVMSDHLHLALRGDIEHSPLEIGMAFQNNLAYLLGQVRIWSDGFYAGTFSEYDMGAIRARADHA